VNPRASRTVPFVAKATGVPVAKIGARVMAGAKLATDFKLDDDTIAPHVAVKEAVFPFARFPDVDTILGPEMKSTGEVMGIDVAFGQAFAKSQAAAYGSLPTSGRVFVSVANRDKRAMVFPAARLADLGFEVLATKGTANTLRRNGIPCIVVRKHFEGPDNIVDLINAGQVDMIINTPYGNPGPRVDGYEIRTAAVSRSIPCITTMQGAAAAVQGIEALIRGDITVRPLQSLHAALRAAPADPHSAGSAGFSSVE
jgi:carbamoyl-phosphate synthase large subunit